MINVCFCSPGICPSVCKKCTLIYTITPPRLVTYKYLSRPQKIQRTWFRRHSPSMENQHLFVEVTGDRSQHGTTLSLGWLTPGISRLPWQILSKSSSVKKRVTSTKAPVPKVEKWLMPGYIHPSPLIQEILPRCQDLVPLWIRLFEVLRIQNMLRFAQGMQDNKHLNRAAYLDHKHLGMETPRI